MIFFTLIVFIPSANRTFVFEVAFFMETMTTEEEFILIACLLNKLRFAFVTIRLQSQSFGLFKLFIFYLFCFLDLKYRLSKNFNPIICDIINNQLFRIFQDVLLIGIVGKHSHETFLKVSEINLSIMNTNLLKIFKIN